MNNKIKKVLKDILPKQSIDIFKILYRWKQSKKVINYFNTKNNKNVLISYITYPFINEISYKHTNNIEAITMAKVFNELEYNVDIYDISYDSKIDYSRYDIIIGFGKPLENYFYQSNKCKVIFYGTTMHPYEQNLETIKRVKDNYKETKKFLLESSRINTDCNIIETILCDAIITLGNEVTVKSYKKYFEGNVYRLNASFYNINNNIKFKKYYGENNFLWFGSTGALHKGLDILINIFSKREDINLYICGPIDKEKEFIDIYNNKLIKKNIFNLGFIDIKSNDFIDLVNKCTFTILPSCSEGASASVLNVMAQGLIPILHKNSSIDIDKLGIEIEKIDENAINEAINKALMLNEKEIKQMSKACMEYVINNNSIEKYYEELKYILSRELNI